LKQSDFDKIERYIKGEAEESETKYVDSFFINGEDNLYFKNCLNKDWELILNRDTSHDVNLNHLLERIHYIIIKNETLKRQKPLQKLIRIYTKAAAIMLIPILVAGGFAYSYLSHFGKTPIVKQVNSTIFAPLGARVSFNLPDGTTGMLNSGSHLTYSLPFITNRIIRLEGEAWFDVKHDEKQPFKINAGNSIVKVLGTSFNLSAYPAENYVEIVLKEGNVEYFGNKGDEKVTMQPSERLIFQNGKIYKSLVDPAKYYSWTDGKLIFRGDAMAEVARRIERWYNVKINISSRELEKYSFRGTFQDDSLEDVLRFLCLTSPIKFKITPREQMADGTFKKEEVTIYKRD
jgi:transmembrane sensor